VKLLLTTQNVKVNAKNKSGWAPLSHATEGGYKDLVKLLIKAGTEYDYEYTVSVSDSAPSLESTLVNVY
jgi:ankyrin repeat protein